MSVGTLSKTLISGTVALALGAFLMAPEARAQDDVRNLPFIFDHPSEMRDVFHDMAFRMFCRNHGLYREQIRRARLGYELAKKQAELENDGHSAYSRRDIENIAGWASGWPNSLENIKESADCMLSGTASFGEWVIETAPQAAEMAEQIINQDIEGLQTLASALQAFGRAAAEAGYPFTQGNRIHAILLGGSMPADTSAIDDAQAWDEVEAVWGEYWQSYEDLETQIFGQ